MRSLKFLMILATIFVTSQAVFAQSDTADIRAIWSQDVFVLINTSARDVNVSNLSFESADGEILPQNWAMNTFGDSNLSYSLAEFEPGSCLLASLAGTTPALPENVECSRIVGEFKLTNAGDIVWDVSQGGFSANVEGEAVAQCDINRTSCDIAVSTTLADPMDATMTAADSDTADIRAIWNQEVFVLINTSPRDVNVSDLGFGNAQGAILPQQWVMNTFGDNNLSYSLAEFEPGSCLVAHLSGTSPDLPENVDCSRVAGEFTLINAADIVWDASQGGFSANIADEVIAQCDVTGNRCDITVATTLANPINAITGDKIGLDVRAIWSQDVFVLVNTSGKDLNVANLSFDSANGEILPQHWVMNTFGDNNLPYSLTRFEPGSCLLAHLSGTDPALPENVDCSRVAGEFTLTNAQDIIWDVTQGGFSANIAGEAVAQCDITGNRCDIPLMIGE